MQIIRDRRARNSVATPWSVRRDVSRRGASPPDHSRIRKPSHKPPTRSHFTPGPTNTSPFRAETPCDVRIRRRDIRGRSRRLRGCNERRVQRAELHFNFIGSTFLLRVPSSRPYSVWYKLSAIETAFVKQDGREDWMIILHVHLHYR